MPNVMNNRLADSLIEKIIDALPEPRCIKPLPDEDYRELRNEIAEMIPGSVDVMDDYTVSDEDCLKAKCTGRTCKPCPIYEEEE